MNDPLAKAEAAVTEAAGNTDLVRQVVVALQVQQALNDQQQAPACQHSHQRQDDFNAKKWLTIGALACVGGCVACAFVLAFAVAMTAIAIGGTCATVCLLVLRSVWRDYLKNR